MKSILGHYDESVPISHTTVEVGHSFVLGHAFVCSVVIAGRGPAYSGPEH